MLLEMLTLPSALISHDSRFLKTMTVWRGAFKGSTNFPPRLAFLKSVRLTSHDKLANEGTVLLSKFTCRVNVLSFVRAEIDDGIAPAVKRWIYLNPSMHIGLTNLWVSSRAESKHEVGLVDPTGRCAQISDLRTTGEYKYWWSFRMMLEWSRKYWYS